MKNHLKRMMRQAAVIFGVSLLLSLGFNTFSSKGINPFRHAVASETTFGAFRPISLEEAQKVVESGILILDARPKEDFRAGHIPGAISLPYYDMGSESDGVLSRWSRQQSIVIYCSETSCADAELLARSILELGYTDLRVFKGGYKAWVAAGLAIERQEP